MYTNQACAALFAPLRTRSEMVSRLIAVRTQARERLWPLVGSEAGPKGHGGACRTTGGKVGVYDERWGLSLVQCQEECVYSLATSGKRCVAYEFALVSSRWPDDR